MDRGERDTAIETKDWSAIADWLDSLTTEEDLAEARRWWRTSGRAAARESAQHDARGPARAIQLALAFALAADGEEASKACRWGHTHIYRDDADVLARVAGFLVRRGAEFAQDVISHASSIRLRGDAQLSSQESAVLMSAAITTFDLPLPPGDNYVLGWARLVQLMKIYSERTSDWRPNVVLAPDGAGGLRPAYPLDRPTTLAEVLRASPRLTDAVCGALAVPNGLRAWSTDLRAGDWSLTDAARDLIASGDLDGDRVRDAVLEALTRTDKAGPQQAYARLLAACDLTPAETRERADLITSILPVVHGSVTKVLLDLALAADLPVEQLEDIGGIILARTEKAQKQTLVKHLGDLPDSQTRRSLLTLAAGADDAGLATKAAALLAAAGSGDGAASTHATAPTHPTVPPLAGAWSVAVENPGPGPFLPFPPDERGLDALRSDTEIWRRGTTEATTLDLLVRWGARDLESLRRALNAEDMAYEWMTTRTLHLAQRWARGEQVEPSYEQQIRSMTVTADQVLERQQVFVNVPHPLVQFTDGLVVETVGRLGSVTELLSTPTQVDGSLTAEELARRIAQAEDYGPYDLVQALLRLGPVDPSDAGLFEALHLPPVGARSRGLFRRRVTGPDGAQVVSDWIRAGGLTGHTVTFSGGEPQLAAAAVPLPDELLALRGIHSLKEGFGPEPGRTWPVLDLTTTYLGVLPHGVETYAAHALTNLYYPGVEPADELGLLVGSSGRFGPAAHQHLARLLAHDRADRRLVVAEQVAILIHQGRLDPQLLSQRAVDLAEHGTISLARIADGLEQVAQVSALDAVWPTWTALIDHALAQPKKPAGLADLLRTAKGYASLAAAHLGTSALPESVRDLAGSKDTTKAAVEARALVAATDAGGERG